MLFAVTIFVTLALLSPCQGQSCADKGKLGTRLRNLLNGDDGNQNGEITYDEFYQNSRNSYDADKNGCVNVSEWKLHWTNLNFTEDYAVQRLSELGNLSNPSCAFTYDIYKGDFTTIIPDNTFMSWIVNALVVLCTDPAKVAMTKDNCDCLQLKDTCINSFVNSTDACKNVVNVDQFGAVCDGKGYIAARINNVLDEIDTDGDDVITGLEQYNDFAVNIDQNNDSCISRQEWSHHLREVLKFSHEFTKQRLTEIAADVTVPCIINYSAYKVNGTSSVPRAVFAQRNLQTLVNICTNDADLYRTNCDCAQLKDGCMNDPKMAANVVCKAYVSV